MYAKEIIHQIERRRTRKELKKYMNSRLQTYGTIKDNEKEIKKDDESLSKDLTSFNHCHIKNVYITNNNTNKRKRQEENRDDKTKNEDMKKYDASKSFTKN